LPCGEFAPEFRQRQTNLRTADVEFKSVFIRVHLWLKDVRVVRSSMPAMSATTAIKTAAVMAFKSPAMMSA
jgi:hypothetical protein